MKKINTKQLVIVAILGALSAVLLMFNFPLPIAPSFYKIDFADVCGLIGGFALGPMCALYIQIVKIIINIIIEGGSKTMFVGELANFIMSSSLCVVAAIIYKQNKTKKGAIKAMVIGSLSMVVVAAIANYFLIIPAYVAFMNFPLEAIINMGKAIVPLISNKLTLILLCTVPFNIVKVVFVDLVTFILYKRVSPLIKRIAG